VLAPKSNSLAAYPTFKASARGDLKTVHKLQKLLMKSRSARLLAVRRVTQETQGKKTAGIDGVKSISPAGRLALAEAIHPKRMSKRKPKPLYLDTKTRKS
jgi:RNA-directed DNA polymerase